jgi:hypothetical protein
VELLLFAREKGMTYEDVTEAYDELKKNRVREVTLALMKAALMPEKCCAAATIVMLQQDGGAIEQRAVEGLKMAAQVMMGSVKAKGHGAME